MLFGKRDSSPPPSIKSIPLWDEIAAYLGQWIGVDYEVVTTKSVALIYGMSDVEVARDKNNVTMLVPNSFNEKANFRDFLSLSMNSLDTGFSEEVKGGAVVGHDKTCVNRLFVDGFVNAASKIYGTPLQAISARVHRSMPFPMLLISDQLTFIISPHSLPKERPWQRGKYGL